MFSIKSLFKKKKKKKLTLEEIHSLYLVLKPSLPESEERFLIDQIDRMLEKMTPEMFMVAVEIMHGKIKKTNNPIELSVLFIKGLTDNNFFEYVSFVERMVKNAQ